jgi:RHS repeat-associated protein
MRRYGLGSTTQLTGSTGAVVKTYQYDAYGSVRSQTGTQPNEFTFTGEQVDSSGLQYLRARYYDGATGRFVGRDPLPLMQRYAYVGGNPVNLTDPSGLCPWGVPQSVCKAGSNAKTVGTHAARASAGWLSEPDNIEFVIQTAAGITMAATCGPQALWAPDTAVCGAATMVYAAAVFYQATQSRTFAGGACVAATSAPALLPGPVGLAGKVVDFAFDLVGAMCVPRTAESAAVRTAERDKEGPVW